MLCYSHQSQLDIAPYEHFLSVYGEELESNEERSIISNNERAKIVRHYLGIIAKILIENNLKTSDVFETNKEGLIYAENFHIGIAKLGFEKDTKKYFNIMIEAMQDENASELCINMHELNSILAHYGVNSESIRCQSDKEEDYNEDSYESISSSLVIQESKSLSPCSSSIQN